MNENDGDTAIAIGLGSAAILMDGEEIYDGEERAHRRSWDKLLTYDHAAQIAMHYPDSLVEVVIQGPFWGCRSEWRDGKWVVTATDGGFA
jgi:hypothetical protein